MNQADQIFGLFRAETWQNDNIEKLFLLPPPHRFSFLQFTPPEIHGPAYPSHLTIASGQVGMSYLIKGAF